jgi:hypothetical protein
MDVTAVAVSLPDSGNAAAKFLQLQLVSHSFFILLSLDSLSMSFFFSHSFHARLSTSSPQLTIAASYGTALDLTVDVMPS